MGSASPSGEMAQEETERGLKGLADCIAHRGDMPQKGVYRLEIIV